MELLSKKVLVKNLLNKRLYKNMYYGYKRAVLGFILDSSFNLTSNFDKLQYSH